MYLDGTIGERIGDLRTSAELSQKQLSAIIQMAPSQLSRIETGQTEHISSDILIKLSKALNVSVDYILGLTKIKSRKNYDIDELGLSETTVKSLVNKSVDPNILNYLFENKRFTYLMFLIKSYLDNSISNGIAERNTIIDMATMALGDFEKENPGLNKDVKEDIRLLKSNKLGNHEAELEKIKNVFLQALKEIKIDFDKEKMNYTPATKEYLNSIKSKLSDKPISDITAKDVTNAVTNMLTSALPMNEQSSDLFRNLLTSMLEPNSENEKTE